MAQTAVQGPREEEEARQLGFGGSQKGRGRKASGRGEETNSGEGNSG
jgi:hypothetical protein